MGHSKQPDKKQKTTKIIVIAAVAAAVIAIGLTLWLTVFKKDSGENGNTSASSVTTSDKANSEKKENVSSETKSYTSEELSQIAQWWETVSVYNE